jgi:hypothetical protein
MHMNQQLCQLPNASMHQQGLPAGMQLQHEMGMYQRTAASGQMQPQNNHGMFKEDSAVGGKQAPGLRTGFWLRSEHELFLSGLAAYGRNWKMIAAGLTTRTSSQVWNSHNFNVSTSQKVDTHGTTCCSAIGRQIFSIARATTASAFAPSSFNERWRRISTEMDTV